MNSFHRAPILQHSSLRVAQGALLYIEVSNLFGLAPSEAERALLLHTYITCVLLL